MGTKNERYYLIKENSETLDKMISQSETIGGISDGYHTFDELYHHRAVLTAALFNAVASTKLGKRYSVWKSRNHHDPNFPMYDGMFIVGMDTPAGQITYHYDIEPYWNMFTVPVVERATEYDGHTPADAAKRLAVVAGLIPHVK